MINTAPKKYERAFTMRVDEAFTEALDEARGAELPVLNRADYIRKLVFEAVTRKRRKEAAALAAAPRKTRR
jgi:hypothetical protein